MRDESILHHSTSFDFFFIVLRLCCPVLYMLFLPPGSGPRHLAVHERYKNFLYVICELTGDVYVYKKKKTGYEMIQKISSLEDNFQGENTAAAIKFSRGGRGPRDFEVFGRYLVIANQYSGNLAVVEYSEESGELKLLPSREKADQPVMICPITKS